MAQHYSLYFIYQAQVSLLIVLLMVTQLKIQLPLFVVMVINPFGVKYGMASPFSVFGCSHSISESNI